MSDFQDLNPATPTRGFGSDHVQFGVPIPKQKRLEMLDDAEWEAFTEEWALSLKSQYHSVKRHSGSGDKGLDVVGFLASEQFSDGYDNYQCKKYNQALAPSDVWVEFGKVIFYTWRGDYPAPRQYFFAAPKGVGTKLLKLLADADGLKEGLIGNWANHCATGITSEVIPLEGGLLDHLRAFDFTIFKAVSAAQLIEGHAQTPFHSVRFGGGLPQRSSFTVPRDVQPEETRYTEQLLEAYSDNSGEGVTRDNLDQFIAFAPDFQIQRQRFYSAESLKNFARDSVPPGTFDNLQDEALDVVYDTCQTEHSCGLTRMRATLNQVVKATFSASPLFSRILEQDKKGICHQLANENKLTWVP
jgi:hypothetical protein